MADDKQDEGYLGDGAWLVLGLAGLGVAAVEANNRGMLSGIGGKKVRKRRQSANTESEAPTRRKKKAPAKKKTSAKKKTTKKKAPAKKKGASNRPKSAYQQFAGARMAHYRKQGYSSPEAMSMAAADWRAKKG